MQLGMCISQIGRSPDLYPSFVSACDAILRGQPDGSSANVSSGTCGCFQKPQSLKLGPALLPYLEGLDSAQLQLITTHASRLSQARLIASDG